MENHLRIARTITDLMENKFGIGKFRIGFDPILGVIPGIGDLIPFVISMYLVWIGVQMRLPQEKVVEMVGNVVVDFLIGLVPVVGDIADIAFRANSKNMKILEEFSTNKGSIVEGEVVS
jgi:hypothetical protein